MVQPDPDKSVFISYRRSVSSFIARAVFEDLRQNGFDAFMDVESIDSGTFDTIILNQIAARAHFVVVLTRGSVERCVEPGDWLRREIERAIDLQRNIVPLLVEEFNFAEVEEYLTGKLSQLSRYNSVRLYHEYFDEAMERLRTRYLKQPVSGPLIPVPITEQEVVQQKIQVAASGPRTSMFELNAEIYFARAYTKERRGNLEGAIEDYGKAIRGNADYHQAYVNRGNLYKFLGRFEEALADFNEAIRIGLNPVEAYDQRGQVYFEMGRYDLAFDDFQKVNALRPALPPALAGLAITQYADGSKQEARRLWNVLVALDPNYRDVDWVREQLNWTDALADQARQVVAELIAASPSSN